MDVKKSIIIVAGVIVVAAVVLAIAAVAYNFINGNISDGTSSDPTATPTSTASGVTQSPGATTPASSAGAPTGPPTGPIYASAAANQSSGMCLVSILLNKDATPIDAGKLSMSIDCNGITYRNAWTMKSSDWGYTDGDNLLEFNEVISPQIDTVALGIPQGRALTIKILQDGAVLQEITVTPT